MNTHIQTRLTYQHIMQIKSRQQRRRRALLICIGLLIGFAGGFATARYVKAQGNITPRAYIPVVANEAAFQQIIGLPCTYPPEEPYVCLQAAGK